MLKTLRYVSGILLPVLGTFLLTTIVLAQEEVPAPYRGMKNQFAWTDAAARNAGKSVYQKQCFSCHGDQGADITEINFGTAEFRKLLETRTDFIFWRVSEGVPTTEMKAWKTTISETQRWQALVYIHSFSNDAAPLPVSPIVPTAPGGTPVIPAVPGANTTPNNPADPNTPVVPGDPAAPANTPAAGVNVPAGKPAAVLPVINVVLGRADVGRKTFTGNIVLKNRGPACISCHNFGELGLLGGGTMAPDLYASYEGYGKDGLISFLQKLRTPVMKATFGDRPLTDSEIVDIVSFLQQTNSAQLAMRNAAKFFAAGAAGAIILILIMQLVNRSRVSGVRRRLVEGDAK